MLSVCAIFLIMITSWRNHYIIFNLVEIEQLQNKLVSLEI